MMADMRLIDANALDLRNRVPTDMGGLCFIEDIETAIEQAPTIDPESLRPVGRWLYEVHKENANCRWNVTAVCSECSEDLGEIWAGFFPGVPDWLARDVALQDAKEVKLSNFCPHCGARMRGENNGC